MSELIPIVDSVLKLGTAIVNHYNLKEADKWNKKLADLREDLFLEENKGYDRDDVHTKYLREMVKITIEARDNSIIKELKMSQ